jgi:hypothetical protein
MAGDSWAAGLGRLSDDELIGVLRAARRLASWAAAMELDAVAGLWDRRTAEEDAGDAGAALHADDEIAAALTLTRHAANQVLDLAVALRRLPATAAALTVGDIDLPRAKVIADEVTGLTSAHAAAVDRAIIGAAPGQTTGQLRAATHRAVLAADPSAADKRKEEALRQARVERWAEPAGTAALAGRDLPPAGVLAADANLTALAKQLKAAGATGTMDTLRAEIYLALLTGAPVTSLLPADHDRHPSTGSATSHDATSNGGTNSGSSTGNGGTNSGSSTGNGGTSSGSSAGDTSSTGSHSAGSHKTSSDRTGDGRGAPGEPAGPTAAPANSRVAQPSPGAFPSFAGPLAGSVNLTMPLATWLGLTDSPGHAAGFGPLDASDSRALGQALAARPDTKWCLTVTGPDGQPVAHGCARARPSPRRRRRAASGSRDRPAVGSRDGPGEQAQDAVWTFTLTRLDRSECDHTWETPAYEPSAGLRHLVRIRHLTCMFPGCRRPAAQCDADHTLAYDRGGRSCLCNLAPLCRHHHQTKQTRGWALQQATPGILTWTSPSGRRYTVRPGGYPA